MVSKVNKPCIPVLNSLGQYIFFFTDTTVSDLLTFVKEFCIYVYEGYYWIVLFSSNIFVRFGNQGGKLYKMGWKIISSLPPLLFSIISSLYTFWNSVIKSVLWVSFVDPFYFYELIVFQNFYCFCVGCSKCISFFFWPPMICLIQVVGFIVVRTFAISPSL